MVRAVALTAYRQYVEQYPSSRYVPRLATTIFDARLPGVDARRVVDQASEIVVPDLFWAEVGSVLWRRHRVRELAPAEALGMLEDMFGQAVRSVPVQSLISNALIMAMALGHSIYDCVYLALADREECRLVTADRRFHRVMQESEFADLGLWIGEVA